MKSLAVPDDVQVEGLAAFQKCSAKLSFIHPQMSRGDEESKKKQVVQLPPQTLCPLQQQTLGKDYLRRKVLTLK